MSKSRVCHWVAAAVLLTHISLGLQQWLHSALPGFRAQGPGFDRTGLTF
jgi:hypothetical protein